jgi:hypothetical protein
MDGKMTLCATMKLKVLPPSITMKPLTPTTMGKYLKQAFVMELERQLSRGEISHSFMVDSMQEECIKNYLAETSNTEEK